MTNMRGREPVVVVGVDGSVVGQHALGWAITEGAVRGWRVRATHVWSPPAAMSPIGSFISPIDVQACEREAKLLLEDAVHRKVEETGADPAMLEAALVRGYTPQALLDRAAGAQLLVVGTRGRGGFSGLMLGSVSQHCTAHATAPVVVVPPTALVPARGDVVVGVDGSSGSQVALEWAVEEAAARGVTLRVVHAWWVQHPMTPADFPYLSVDRRALIERSRRLLHEITSSALAHVGREPAHIDLVPIERPAARGLLEETEHAGLLVVGTRGRGGFRGLLLGSVSQQCIHHATSAVAVIPTRRDDTEREDEP